jgi:hypothetical protein
MKPTGAVLWEGDSRLDGKPIVAIATGLRTKSQNGKTGEMIQTWILRRDVSPAVAKRSGADVSICGDCIHRAVGGLGTCYVNVGWGPQGIWKAYRKGIYPQLDDDIRESIRQEPVRFGSYGDPVAVPSRVWNRIMPRRPKDVTGYTHAWRRGLAQHYKKFLMASVESEAEAKEAKAKGWRSFLVVPLNRSIPRGFAWCPSDRLNPGPKIPCEDCGACSGTRGGSKSIGIFVHGNGAASFGFRERKANIALERKELNYDPLIRLSPALHRALKKKAKKQGMTLKKFVDGALRRGM